MRSNHTLKEQVHAVTTGNEGFRDIAQAEAQLQQSKDAGLFNSEGKINLYTALSIVTFLSFGRFQLYRKSWQMRPYGLAKPLTATFFGPDSLGGVKPEHLQITQFSPDQVIDDSVKETLTQGVKKAVGAVSESYKLATQHTMADLRTVANDPAQSSKHPVVAAAYHALLDEAAYRENMQRKIGREMTPAEKHAVAFSLITGNGLGTATKFVSRLFVAGLEKYVTQMREQGLEPTVGEYIHIIDRSITPVARFAKAHMAEFTRAVAILSGTDPNDPDDKRVLPFITSHINLVEAKGGTFLDINFANLIEAYEALSHRKISLQEPTLGCPAFVPWNAFDDLDTQSTKGKFDKRYANVIAGFFKTAVDIVRQTSMDNSSRRRALRTPR